jgi:hypothetical protein
VRHVLVLAREVGFGRRDTFELDERAEAGDLVEVDAHALPEQQVAALVDDHAGAERRVERLAQGGGIAHVGEAVGARARLLAIGPRVGDELGAARLLLAQLQPPARAAEVRVALGQDALVRGAERERALERPARIGVARLDLDVAAGRGHAAGTLVMPRAHMTSGASSARCTPTLRSGAWASWS